MSGVTFQRICDWFVTMPNDRTSPSSLSSASQLSGAITVGMLWSFSLAVLYPAHRLRSQGFHSHNSIGQYPADLRARGAGRYYSKRFAQPVFMSDDFGRLESVHDFDENADLYEALVSPATRPVHAEAFRLIQRFVSPRARVLDLSCGPGTETVRLAAAVPKGEVVCVDLSPRMIATAWENAQRHGLDNVAAIQAEATRLPAHFAGRFDIVHCSYAFHHFQDPLGVLTQIRRVLNRTGKVFIVDNGPWWFNLMSTPIASFGDPGFVAFHTGEEFQRLFREAGFSGFYWEEILPGVGISIGSK